MSDDGENADPHIVAGHKEHVEGRAERDPDAYPHSGTVRDRFLSRFLAVIEQDYDPEEAANPEEMPGSARDLQLVKDIRAMEATEAGREAVEHGDMGTLQHQQGNTNQRADISGVKAIQAVDDLIDGPAPVVVVLGDMGAGKSQFGGLLGQRFVHKNPNALVGSNIRSLQATTEWTDEYGDERDGYLPSFPKLKEWLQQDGDPLQHSQRPKLAFLDELSSEASGSGKDGQLTRKLMGPLVFKIRKYGGALVAVGHDESSIHPMLWRVGKVVKKVSQKKAVVADRIKNGEIRDIEAEIEGIPQTDWRFKGSEPSRWSWQSLADDGTGEPEVAETDVKRVSMWTIAQGMKDGNSPRAIAENIPYSHQTVRDWFEEYEEGGEKREWVADVEAAIA